MLIRFALVLLYVLALQGNTRALPLIWRRDAPFEHVRTGLLLEDHSDLEPNRPEKYFHEAKFHSHYDGRFADKQLPDGKKRAYLVSLVQAYLATMTQLGVETFIVHGSLLGWYWNRKIMPWDDDVDVMVSERSIYRLAAYHNMTVHTFRVPAVGGVSDFLLEVNPHYATAQVDNINKIDARWIDMQTGLYIDITTLRRNQTAGARGADGAMMVKDKHHYKYDDVYPLRQSVFEGFPVNVPFAYGNLLTEEYGADALTQSAFQQFRFNEELGEWYRDAYLEE